MFQLEKKEIRAPATAGRQAWPGCEWAHSSPPTKREVRLEGERWELSLQREESGEKKKSSLRTPGLCVLKGWIVCHINCIYLRYQEKPKRETPTEDSKTFDCVCADALSFSWASPLGWMFLFLCRGLWRKEKCLVRVVMRGTEPVCRTKRGNDSGGREGKEYGRQGQGSAPKVAMATKE